MITTPNDFLKSLNEISRQISNIPQGRIDQFKLFEILNGLFSDSNVGMLNSWKDIPKNRMIVLETLKLCRLISEHDFKVVSEKLLKINTDEETRKEIVEFGEKKSIKRFVFRLALLFFAVMFLINFIRQESTNNQYKSNSYQPEESSDEVEHQNGDLNSEFSQTDENAKSATGQDAGKTGEKPIEELNRDKKKEWEQSGWKEMVISNGLMPDCYNVTPRYSEINNYLDIKVGAGTDVVIKLMERESDRCVRYVYVNRSSNYILRNIPEGEYYLKIAYGKNWYSKVENHFCEGKFLANAIYEMGKDNLDFNLKYYADGRGYDVPSYRLSLDVYNSDAMNSFSSERISESEFNN